jgi:ADP-heptose:LPS heptosyltransferase
MVLQRNRIVSTLTISNHKKFFNRKKIHFFLFFACFTVTLNVVRETIFTKMAHILAIRFSALGDIVMAVPVIYSFAKRYPEHEITLLSRNFAAPLFETMPQNVHFMGIDLKDYKGVLGLHRLFCELRKKRFDAVADFHDVLRTKYLSTAFRMAGVSTAVIEKGRSEKKRLTRTRHKELHQLTTSTQRYAATLAELGYPFETQEDTQTLFQNRKIPDRIQKLTGEKGDLHWIGIAPFAAHKGKIYPLSKMEKVIALLSSENKNRIFLFGAGEKEKSWCCKWQSSYSGVTSVAGIFSLSEELALMGHLNVMLTMDSANMHLAALCHTPIVSIWGATHHYAGFTPKPLEHDRRIELNMECRPCSIYGKKSCTRGDYACLQGIKPEVIVNAIEKICNLH